MDQNTLAKKLGVSQSTVSRWLGGKSKPRGLYKEAFEKLVEPKSQSKLCATEATPNPRTNNPNPLTTTDKP
jgi:transcriptional regulator with XRE-family HTH domain